jgi:hypothetical protein
MRDGSRNFVAKVAKCSCLNKMATIKFAEEFTISEAVRASLALAMKVTKVDWYRKNQLRAFWEKGLDLH